MQKAVTLSDVASVAGVSLSTASKALNGSPGVSVATRERINDVARRLDFRPNALAQSFARGKSRTIGILTQNAKGTWSGPILVGAATELGAREQATLLYDAAFDASTLETSVRRLQDRRIDGLLVIGDGPHLTMRSVTHAFQVPVAYVFTRTDRESDTVFAPDNERAGRLAAEHLLALGRTRLAHITVAGDAAAQERSDGFAKALAEAGLNPVATVANGEWSEATGAELVTRLLDDGIEPDGIFCGNDHMARGAERVVQSRGMQVPGDVALIGVDNWEGLVIGQGSQHLTTVDMQLASLGVAAADHLLAGERDSGLQTGDCTLVIGETAPGAAGSPT